MAAALHSRKSIAFRLVVWLVVSSFCVTLVLSGVELYREYASRVAGIEEELDRIERSHLPALSRAVWVMNTEQVRFLLQGVLQIQDVARAAVYEGDSLLAEEGQALAGAVIERRYPVTHYYNGQQRRIGTLLVQADLASVRASMGRDFLAMFLDQGLRILAISLLMALVTYYLVARHLRHIALRLRSSNASEQPEPISLHRPPAAEGKGDELDDVVEAINSISAERYAHMTRLTKELEYSTKVEEALHAAYNEMEQRVQERTVELEEARNRAEDSSATKSEFLANMSHEIRTPLNGVLGMLQLAASCELADEPRECVDVALRSGRTLLTVINDILDFSKIEAGKIEIREEPFHLPSMLDTVSETFAITAREKNVELQMTLDQRLPEMVCGDEGRLRQVLFNLLGNAMKFTRQGSVTLEVYPLPPTGENGTLRMLFSVSDTGIGIEDDKLEAIFEPFSQVDGSHTRRYQGSGLGLSIVKRLVNLMGGSISIASEQGEGTEVFFCVSMKKTDAVLPSRKTSQQVTAGSSKVLLVEDNAVNRLMLERMLAKLGHETLCAENGEEALQLLARNSVDLVLMDIQMPVLDGLQATEKLRRGEAGEHAANVPVAALTAHAMKGDRERFMHAGMDDYIAKPVDMDELEALLERLCSLEGRKII